MRIHNAWHFFFFLLISFWNTTGSHLEWNSIFIGPLHLICQVWLSVCLVGIDADVDLEPSFALVLVVPPLLRPFCQRLDNGRNHFRLRCKHSWFAAREEWGAGRQRSCRRSAGSLDRSSVPSAQLVREGLGGSSRRGMVGWCGGRTGACRQ